MARARSFLPKDGIAAGTAPPSRENQVFLDYLPDRNRGYRIVQHGFHHDPFEFGITDRFEIASRLDRGAAGLLSCRPGSRASLCGPP